MLRPHQPEGVNLVYRRLPIPNCARKNKAAGINEDSGGAIGKQISSDLQ